MESSHWRIMTLVLSITTVLTLFKFHLFITVTPFECWSFEEVWKHNPSTLNPFWMYSLVFSLLTIWALIELLIGVTSQTHYLVPLVSLLLMISVLFGHLHLWQSFKVIRGEENFNYFTLEIISIRIPLSPSKISGSPPDWREYLIENRCSKGLAISSMSEKEKQKLKVSYQALWYKWLNR